MDKGPLIDFSSVIYPHANLRWLKMYLAERIDCIGQYPPADPVELERMIAGHLDISEDSVLVTNGCTGAIYLVAQLFRGGSSIIPLPTFHEYANACRVYGHTISFEKTDELSSLSGNLIYWICNPNCPSGNVLMKGFMDYIVRRGKQSMFVIDQSYESFTREGMLVPREVTELPNLVLLHSLGKEYSVPGLRVGYITAHPSIIQRLREIRIPWPISSFSMEAARYLLAECQRGVPDLESYLCEAERLRGELKEIGGIRMFESKSNFMLGQIETATTQALKQYLMEHHNILIHDCSLYEGLFHWTTEGGQQITDNCFFRVTARTPKEDDLLVNGIRQFMEDGPSLTPPV